MQQQILRSHQHAGRADAALGGAIASAGDRGEALAGLIAVAALNIGLLCRVVAEPLERDGHASDFTALLLALSALLQIAAAAIFVTQLWPRVAPRLPRAVER